MELAALIVAAVGAIAAILAVPGARRAARRLTLRARYGVWALTHWNTPAHKQRRLARHLLRGWQGEGRHVYDQARRDTEELTQ